MKFARLIGCFVVTLFLLSASCHKSNDNPPTSTEKYCWQLYDFNGNTVDTVCGKTEDEMKAGFALYLYEHYDVEKFCWRIVGGNDIRNVSEMYATHFWGGNATKIDCNEVIDCSKWYSRQKNIFKPTTSITYSNIKANTLCDDTLTVLYDGREITLRETADSLIVQQFSNDGTF